MIELGKILIKDNSSIVEARNKIHLLAEDLKFSSMSATRLATITSDLSRSIYQKDIESSLTVGFEERKDIFGLVLIFQGKGTDLNIKQIELFFDNLQILPTKSGLQKIRTFKYLTEPEFKPTKEFIDMEKERLIRLSREELFSEVKRKNEELLKILDERKKMWEKLQDTHRRLEMEKTKVDRKVKRRTQQLLATSEELKKELIERKEMQERLVRSEKLAILGQLAGGVGHELRNPLGAIKNAAYFLKMVLDAPEPEVKETLEILEKEVATSEHIISALLDFARPKPLARHKVEIDHLLQEIISHTTVPEKVKVVNKLDKSLPQILADPVQLSQVFKNLILNAIQAMPDGGQLVIKSEILPQELVAISFTDSGIGISRDNLEKLFQPLFTTKAKGIGLGLAITKTLVEKHGGTIELQSEPGKGSIFTVRLPIKEKEEG